MSLLLFAGPCVIESETMTFTIAQTLERIAEKLDISFVFKASFDKANRTSLSSFRGPGLKEGLRILKKIREELNIAVITDIHLPEQAEPVAEVADYLQIPAFLCRQTDLLVAAAKTGKPILVKKAQFLAPRDMENVVAKLEKSGNNNIILCERGTSFGYNNLVVDMTSFYEMKKFGHPVIFDATHSVQMPGGNGVNSGGNREHIMPLALAACAAGADGIFLETHPVPQRALCDGANSIALSDVESLLRKALKVHEAIKR